MAFNGRHGMAVRDMLCCFAPDAIEGHLSESAEDVKDLCEQGVTFGKQIAS